MDEGEKICKGGNNMGNRVKYWMCKEIIATFVEKILVNGWRNLGRGKKLIKGEKIWSRVADTHNLEKTSSAVFRFMNMIVWKYGWEGEKICKGGKNMGNRVKYWMSKENIPTFVEKILV